MPNARVKAGETTEEARVRYNAEMSEYRASRRRSGNPLANKPAHQVKKHDLWKKYRITPETYEAMRVAQSNRCAICECVFLDQNAAASHPNNCVVDHCHETTKVRGLLCPACNLGLGKFEDNVDRLKRAISYLS